MGRHVRSFRGDRKMTKFAKITTVALFVVLAAASTVLAGEWTKDEKGWKYLENNQPVTFQWRTDVEGNYFYLGGDGYMVTSSFVDEDRYVDYTGRMVRGRWIQINDKWHYFESSGRMVTGRKKQISNLWYCFDSEGVMITGWYNDGTDWYYCDETGAGHMLTSTWKKLTPAPEMNVETSALDSGDGTYWFYFQNTGKAARATEGGFKEYTIGGVRYAFDTNGIMQTGWVKLSDTNPAIAGYKFFNNDKSLGVYGAAHAGWLSAYPPSGFGGGDVQWYYFDNRGVPAFGTELTVGGRKAYLANFKKIAKNGTTYTYLFTEKGNPVYGLVQVQLSDGSATSMYFGSKSQSCLQKATTVTEGDGNQWLYAFNSQGYGITGIKNNYLYYKGKVQKAMDERLAYYKVGGVTYLVNQSGYLVKGYNRTKDPSVVEYRSNASGVRDGGTASLSVLIEPEYQDQD